MTVVGNMMVKYCSVNYILERLLLLGGAYPVNINMPVYLHCQSKRWGALILLLIVMCCYVLLRIDVTWSV